MGLKVIDIRNIIRRIKSIIIIGIEEIVIKHMLMELHQMGASIPLMNHGWANGKEVWLQRRVSNSNHLDLRKL